MRARDRPVLHSTLTQLTSHTLGQSFVPTVLTGPARARGVCPASLTVEVANPHGRAAWPWAISLVSSLELYHKFTITVSVTKDEQL